MKNEICKCSHHTKDHSYNVEPLEDNNLYCDKCDCKNFQTNTDERRLTK